MADLISFYPISWLVNLDFPGLVHAFSADSAETKIRWAVP